MARQGGKMEISYVTNSQERKADSDRIRERGNAKENGFPVNEKQFFHCLHLFFII